METNTCIKCFNPSMKECDLCFICFKNSNFCIKCLKISMINNDLCYNCFEKTVCSLCKDFVFCKECKVEKALKEGGHCMSCALKIAGKRACKVCNQNLNGKFMTYSPSKDYHLSCSKNKKELKLAEKIKKQLNITDLII